MRTKIISIEPGPYIVEDFVPFGSVSVQLFHLFEDEARGWNGGTKIEEGNEGKELVEGLCYQSLI